MDNVTKAIVIGGGGAIGSAILTTGLARGWRMHATFRTELQRSRALSMHCEYRANLTCSDYDVRLTDNKPQFDAVDAVTKFDYLIISIGVRGTSENLSSNALDLSALDIFAANSIAPIKAALTFGEAVKPGGTVVFLSSNMASIHDCHDDTLAIYRASKAALNMLTRNYFYREALPRNQSVIALHPGWVQSKIGGEMAPTTATEAGEKIISLLEKRHTSAKHAFLNFDGRKLRW